MKRPQQPPDRKFFEEKRPSAGEEKAALVLPGLEVELAGLDTALREAMEHRWGPYGAARATADEALRVSVCVHDEDYFIDPPPVAELNPIYIACDGERVRFLGYRLAGWFDVMGGRGEAVLARGTYEPADRAMENYVRAAVAWQAASRGGALVHGASMVLDGKGYLFFGPSGAGKSTLAENNRRGLVLSDDLSLVLPGETGGLELVGSPFRGTYEGGPPVTGRFPLCGAFRLVQAPQVEVREVARVRGFGELVGNLPFVAEAFAGRPDLFARVESAFEPVPIRHLHFRRDETYWDAILAADPS